MAVASCGLPERTLIKVIHLRPCATLEIPFAIVENSWAVFGDFNASDISFSPFNCDSVAACRFRPGTVSSHATGRNRPALSSTAQPAPAYFGWAEYDRGRSRHDR